MGVRLVKYNRINSETGGSSSFNDHDELINRDMMNQHPIYAIIGLQEVLNILEDTIQETNELLLQKENEINTKIDNSFNGINNDIDTINNQLITINDLINNANIIGSVIDTSSVNLTYDIISKSLKADVKLDKNQDFDNLIQERVNGLFVPKINPIDTTSIQWNKIINVPFNGSTTTFKYFCHYYLSDLDNYTTQYNKFITFMPNGVYIQTDASSIYQNYFLGVLSQNFYDNYTHTVRITSSAWISYQNAIVIAHVTESDKIAHTLSVVVSPGGDSWNYSIVYNYGLFNNQEVVKIGSLLDGTLQKGVSPGTRWAQYYSTGITIEIKKYGNIIEVTTSNWNETILNPATKLKINLNDYSWGEKFSKSVQYGYGSKGQYNSYFYPISFTYDNLLSSKLSAETKLSADATNGLSVKSDGLYSETIKISAQANNALIKNTDGYYTESTRVSTQANNSLVKNTDGLYVRDYANIKTVNKTAHGFIEGDFIYYHPINGYALASAIDDYNSNIVGMVTKVIDANKFEYKWAGFHATTLFTNANGYGQGMPLYISDTDPGKVVQDQPDISKTVGYPIEDIGLIISIERGIQYNQETAIGDFKQSANTYNVRSDGFIKVAEGILYKQTLVDRLLTTLDDAFKASYLVLHNDDQTMEFINTEALYSANNVRAGFNLFIKAF